MIVYRFAHSNYAEDISGMGAKKYGGRWNIAGIPVVYTSEAASLGLLEVLANAGALEELQTLRLVELELPPHTISHEISKEKLKQDWWTDFDYSQWIGSEILKANKHLVIKCPSAIIDSEHNYLINPDHPSFAKVVVRTVRNFRFDERLFK